MPVTSCSSAVLLPDRAVTMIWCAPGNRICGQRVRPAVAQIGCGTLSYGCWSVGESVLRRSMPPMGLGAGHFRSPGQTTQLRRLCGTR